ncbi:Uncharacterised protein [Mycobacteroides abscessus subsp. abscessus]|nr:Uncharacterised protein [Mycobacteroides abscessus subsp. abscessus]SKO61489.1 Uncharacterised protein [Mycobacteroides abscessus subsp. abscessus]SLH92095.1 Uncharacterised protein [Mycobacteroides abscessus subsp. massiliense]SLI31027.1 Uncharacterised protein [Mycobacteroides abscessus subsp. massiliense]
MVDQNLLSAICLVLTALGIRVVLAVVFYVAGALLGQRWATYGNVDIALNRLFRVLPRWGQVLVSLAVVAALLALSILATGSATGVGLGIMIYLITTATVTLPTPANATDRITRFPLRELAGVPCRRRNN